MSYENKIRYKWSQDVGEPVPELGEIAELSDGGHGVQIKWLTANTWTKAELDAVAVEANAWAAEAEKESLSNPVNMGRLRRAAILGMMDVYNLRLPPDKQVDAAEIRAAIKARL